MRLTAFDHQLVPHVSFDLNASPAAVAAAAQELATPEHPIVRIEEPGTPCNILLCRSKPVAAKRLADAIASRANVTFN